MILSSDNKKNYLTGGEILPLKYNVMMDQAKFN